MDKRITVLFVWVIAAAVLLCGCQKISSSTHEDLAFLVKTVQAVHPMGRTGFPQSFHDTIQWAEAEMNRDLTHSEMVSTLTKVLVSLGDAHTAFHYDLAAGDAIDLPLLWLEDGLYVGKGTDVLRQGDKVVSMGGRSTENLLEELQLYVPAENIYWVRVRGEEALQRETMLRSLGLVKPNNTVTVEYTSVASNELCRIELALQPYVPAITQARNPVRPNRGWHVDEELSLGYFFFDTCTIDEGYKRALNTFFSAVKDRDIKNIAVDLRHNSGGNSLATTEFLKYIDTSRYRTYAHVLRIRGLVNIPLNRIGKVYRRNRAYADLVFSGRVFILTSPQTFSAANWFATVFHDNNLATLVGEPIGNSPSAFGNTLKKYVLPTSQLSFSVSMSHFVRPDPTYDPQDSLYPHITVPTTMEDILAGRDPQLDAIKEIILSGR